MAFSFCVYVMQKSHKKCQNVNQTVMQVIILSLKFTSVRCDPFFLENLQLPA